MVAYQGGFLGVLCQSRERIKESQVRACSWRDKIYLEVNKTNFTRKHFCNFIQSLTINFSCHLVSRNSRSGGGNDVAANRASPFLDECASAGGQSSSNDRWYA
jgi:hypothetical protein